MPTPFRVLPLLALGLVLGTSACAKTPAPASKPAAPYQKPGAAVRLSHELQGNAAAGTPLTLTLRFETGGRAGTPLTVSYSATPGLLIRNGEPQRFELDGQTPPQSTLQISAPKDGLYHVNVFVQLAGQSRAFSVPVAIGKVDAKAALKSEGKLETSPDGQRLISLPAQETVPEPK